MRVNRSILRGFFLLMVLTVASCSKEFLDVKVQGGETIASDPNLAEKLVTGVYNSLLQGDSFGNGDVHGWAFMTVTTTMSDDADKGSFADDQKVTVGDLDDFVATPTNQFVSALWSGYYIAIGQCNQALAALSNAPLEVSRQTQLIAEVRFIRGYLYFNMVRMFGGVPLVTRVPTDASDANSDPAFQTRATVDQIYHQINSDLQFAANQLPVRTGIPIGHANKGAAQGILAKAYLYQKNWQRVVELTDSIINSGQYKLLDNYAQLWRQSGDNNVESVFEIETGVFNNTNLGITNYTVCQGPRVGGSGGWNDLGYGFNDPTPNLVSAYEAADTTRRNATIIFIDRSGLHKGTVLWDGFRIPSSDSVQNLYYNYKAYTSATRETFANPSDKDRPKNVRILRYADVLLMNAEAALNLNTGDPAGKVNQVRARAHLAPKASVTVDDIWQERRVELAMEHDRFWDLVRQGRAAAVMQAAGKLNFVEGKNELLPIPSKQIALSGGRLTQNPFY